MDEIEPDYGSTLETYETPPDDDGSGFYLPTPAMLEPEDDWPW